MSFLKEQVSFPSNVASIFSSITHNYPIPFLAHSLKCKFFRFSSARVKICQIPHVNLELRSQFLFKFGIMLHFHDTKLPCQFQAHTFSTLDKIIPWKSQFLDFQTCCGENLLNSSCHFWKNKSVFCQILHQLRVPSNKTPLNFF